MGFACNKAIPELLMQESMVQAQVCKELSWCSDEAAWAMGVEWGGVRER